MNRMPHLSSPAKPVLTLAGLACACLIASGCSSRSSIDQAWTNNDRSNANAWTVREFELAQRNNAIIKQSTIRDDHFVEGTTTLNARGKRELDVLLSHYRKQGTGRLTLDKLNTPDELYASRLEALQASITSAGLDLASVNINAIPWAGDSANGAIAATRYNQPSDEEPYNFHKLREQK